MIINKMVEYMKIFTDWLIKSFSKIADILKSNQILNELISFIAWILIFVIGFAFLFWLIGKFTGEN